MKGKFLMSCLLTKKEKKHIPQLLWILITIPNADIATVFYTL